MSGTTTPTHALSDVRPVGAMSSVMAYANKMLPTTTAKFIQRPMKITFERRRRKRFDACTGLVWNQTRVQEDGFPWVAEATAAL